MYQSGSHTKKKKMIIKQKLESVQLSSTVAQWHPAVKCTHRWLAHRTPIHSVTGWHTTWFMTGNYGYGGDIISSFLSLPHVTTLCISAPGHTCVCMCSHVRFWLISSAVWIQQRLSLFLHRTEDKTCHNSISRSSSRRATMHTRAHGHTFVGAHRRSPPSHSFCSKLLTLCSVSDPNRLDSFPIGNGASEPKSRKRAGTAIA